MVPLSLSRVLQIHVFRNVPAAFVRGFPSLPNLHFHLTDVYSRQDFSSPVYLFFLLPISGKSLYFHRSLLLTSTGSNLLKLVQILATTHSFSMASVSDSEQLREAVKAIHYLAPWVILAYYVIAATVSVCTLQTITAKTKDHKAPRKLILWVMLVIMVIYVRFVLRCSPKAFRCEASGRGAELTTSIHVDW